jgi:hypothetical protein
MAADRGGEVNVDMANLGMRGVIYVPHVVVIAVLNLTCGRELRHAAGAWSDGGTARDGRLS